MNNNKKADLVEQVRRFRARFSAISLLPLKF